MLAPIIPPPMMTTSAVSVISFCLSVSLSFGLFSQLFGACSGHRRETGSVNYRINSSAAILESLEFTIGVSVFEPGLLRCSEGRLMLFVRKRSHQLLVDNVQFGI